MAALATDSLRSENDLLASLAKRRTALKESLRMSVLSQTGSCSIAEDAPMCMESTAESVLIDLRKRRAKRKGQLPPLKLSHDSPPQSLEPLPQSEEKLTDIPGVGIRRLRALRDFGHKTRFDQPLTEEARKSDAPVNHLEISSDYGQVAALESNSRKGWTKLSSQLGEAVKKEVKQQSFDFFTSSINDQEEEEQREYQQEELGEEEEGGERNGNGEEDTEREVQTQDTSEQLENRENVEEGDVGAEEAGEEMGVVSSTRYDEMVVCRYGFPRYIPYHTRVSREHQVYFTPTSAAVLLEQNGEERLETRESGLFVKKQPQFRVSNLHVVENRLRQRQDKGEGWFDDDGHLLLQPNPLRDIITRPLLIAHSGEQIIYHRDPTYLTSLHKYLMTANKTGISAEGHQLEIMVGSLHFCHHPLFSAEHVLSSLLERAYESYHATDRTRLVEHYRQKLQALKYAVLDITQQLTEQHEREQGEVEERGNGHDSNRDTLQRTNDQLMMYKQEIREVRRKLKQTMAAEYTSMQTVLSHWHELKGVREAQGYSSTPTQLLLHRVDTDAEEEATQWERDIADEVAEMREDYDDANSQYLLEYKEELAEWKIYEKKRRRALRRQARNESAQSLTPAGTDAESHASLETITSVPPERPRPQAPSPFDAESAHQQLLQYYHQHRHKPGEPRFVPELNHTHSISQPCPREEQQRRDFVLRTKLKLKILYNDKEVCQTSEYSLGADFMINFTTNFILNVVELPKSIKLQVLDCTSFLPSLVAELFLPIPECNHTSSQTGLEEFQFSSQEKVEPGYRTVGSGHTCSQLPRAGVLVTSGSVSVSVCWGEGPNQESLCPPSLRRSSSQHTDPIPMVGVASVTDIQKIKRWIKESHLDPNDPRNYDLLQLVDSAPSSDGESRYFRLQPIDECARLVDDGEVENDRRFTLLQMRQQGHPGLKGKSIPLNSSSITESVWKSIHQYKPYSLAELPTTIFGNFYEGQEIERARYLQDIRERVTGKERTHTHSQLTTQDVIHDDIIPNISALQKTLVELFSPRRPLKPQRKLRRIPKPQNVHVSECNLIVRIVRAVGVPVRQQRQTQSLGGSVYSHPLSAPQTPRHYTGDNLQRLTQTLGGVAMSDHTHSPSHTLVLTSPFVRVTFGREKRRTRTGCGPNPYWNQELTIPFHPPGGDFSPASLQKVTDVIRLDVIDEEVLDLLYDDRRRGTDIHHRFENQWLGSLTIPFSTLHARTRIEGTFELNQPPLLLGYQQHTDSTHTFLRVFIALEPALSVLPPLGQHFDSTESSQLLDKATVWEKSLKNKFPHRDYTSTVLDVSGKRVIVTRYVLPQNPPDVLLPPEGHTPSQDDLLHYMERLAWYVSLIPSLPDALVFSGTCDIWTTSDQFLKMLGGDEEEHAVLLCNYFLHINQPAYVLLGSGIPEGPTAYVLTAHPCSPGDYLLWNPSTGHHYMPTQHHCPLTSVCCVFNNNNVWGNIQVWEEPSRVTFDLTNKKHWTPLFDDTQHLLSVQQDVLEYADTDIVRVQELQTRLDRVLHEHIVEMRSQHITRWNNHCSRLLMNVLPEFEARPYHSNLILEHQQDLTQHFPAHKLQGFPIHVQCWDTKQLLDEVDLTAIPHCGHERAEFSLALLLHPYPGHVISVWLYLVAMTPV